MNSPVPNIRVQELKVGDWIEHEPNHPHLIYSIDITVAMVRVHTVCPFEHLPFTYSYHRDDKISTVAGPVDE